MITRRAFAAIPLTAVAAAQARKPLDGPWLFSGPHTPETPVTFPHCVARLGWQDWDPATWQDVWTYRKRFAVGPEFRGRRVFLRFGGVMVGAKPAVNGHALPEHLGGYLPFEYELTEFLKPGENELTVVVDGHWLNVPPDGSPRGPVSVDYLEPAGIWRDVSLHAVPNVFIRDVFARPVDVLSPSRRIEVTCTLDGYTRPLSVRSVLMDGSRTIATAEATARGPKVTLTLESLGNITLWHPDRPRLYDLLTMISSGGRVWH